MWKALAIVLVLACASPAVSQSRTRTAAADPAVRQSEMEVLRKQVQELSQRVVALEAEVARLKSGTPAAKDAPAPKAGQPNAAVAEGIRRGKLTVGMTLEQVEKLLGRTGEMVSEGDGAAEYRWTVANSLDAVEGAPRKDPYGVYTLVCTFEGGKLVSYNRGPSRDRGLSD